MKVINVCGFGNTGCTAQADYLSEYEGVRGILADSTRNRSVTNAPYQEFGILKCLYSFGGVIISKLNKLDVSITREQLKNSLMGEVPPKTEPLNQGAMHHLKKRSLLCDEYGEDYREVVSESLYDCPSTFDNLSIDNCLEVIRNSMHVWCNGIEKIIIKKEGDVLTTFNTNTKVIGFKNDPTGAYPLLSSLLPSGLTSAILRNPMDTTYDFNRHYRIANSKKSVEWHCKHYNSQINSARLQIKQFRSVIGDHYFAHDFESFVNSEHHRKKYLHRMVGALQMTGSYFEAEKSMANVDVYKNMEKEFITIVKNNCLENYNDFRCLLKSEGLFLE